MTWSGLRRCPISPKTFGTLLKTWTQRTTTTRSTKSWLRSNKPLWKCRLSYRTTKSILKERCMTAERGPMRFWSNSTVSWLILSSMMIKVKRKYRTVKRIKSRKIRKWLGKKRQWLVFKHIIEEANSGRNSNLCYNRSSWVIWRSKVNKMMFWWSNGLSSRRIKGSRKKLISETSSSKPRSKERWMPQSEFRELLGSGTDSGSSASKHGSLSKTSRCLMTSSSTTLIPHKSFWPTISWMTLISVKLKLTKSHLRILYFHKLPGSATKRWRRYRFSKLILTIRTTKVLLGVRLTRVKSSTTIWWYLSFLLSTKN